MKRIPFQGVLMVVRFNWHFFAIAGGVLVLLAVFASVAPKPFHLAALMLIACMLLGVLVPLIATFWAYDATGLYRLDWLRPWVKQTGRGVNIHAGFDETTPLLRETFPAWQWHVFDFYDPAKHTEISIRRARNSRPPLAGTMAIHTTALKCAGETYDGILLTLAAHEVRNFDERVRFFAELARVLKCDGSIVVTEHMRDMANMLAYQVGAWHFHARKEWLRTFRQAGLVVHAEFKLNPFITTFVLRKS